MNPATTESGGAGGAQQKGESPFRQEQGERVLPYSSGLRDIPQKYISVRVGKDGMAIFRIAMTRVILESSSVADVLDEHMP